MTRRQPVHGAFGALTGAGAGLLLIAYLQREGPGETCTHTATSLQCDSHLNPLPWFILGVILFVAGVVLHARQAD